MSQAQLVMEEERGAIEPAVRVEEYMDKRGSLPFVILRLTLGINMFLHGEVRVARGIDRFIAHYQQGFDATFLPPAFVHASMTMIPYVEVVIGALLILGLWTYWSLVACGLLMTVFVFGTAIREDWNAVMIQMLYALIIYVMLTAKQKNGFSIDALRERYRHS